MALGGGNRTRLRAPNKIKLKVLSGARRDLTSKKSERFYRKGWVQTILLTIAGWLFVQYVSNYSPCQSQLEASNHLIAKNLYESMQRRIRILDLAREVSELDRTYKSSYNDHKELYSNLKARISRTIDPATSFAAKDFEKVDFPELARNIDYEVSKWRGYGALRADLAQSYANLVYYSVLVQTTTWLDQHKDDDGFVYVGKFLEEYLPRVSNVLDFSKVIYDRNSREYRSEVFIDLSDAADTSGLVSENVCIRKSAASILAMVDLDEILKQR